MIVHSLLMHYFVLCTKQVQLFSTFFNTFQEVGHLNKYFNETLFFLQEPSQTLQRTPKSQKPKCHSRNGRKVFGHFFSTIS